MHAERQGGLSYTFAEGQVDDAIHESVEGADSPGGSITQRVG